MIKIVNIFLLGCLCIFMTNCNTPMESEGQSNPYVQFATSTNVFLKVSVNNLIGDEIITVAKKEFPPGYHLVAWDGKNSNGNFVDEGFYHFCIYSAKGKLWRSWLVYYERN